MKTNSRLLVTIAVLIAGAILATAPGFGLTMIGFYFKAVFIFASLYWFFVLRKQRVQERAQPDDVSEAQIIGPLEGRPRESL